MPDIRKDPLGWAALAVATPRRFWSMTAVMVLLYAAVLLQFFSGSRAGAVAYLLMLAVFQCLFLYALRRLYVALRGAQAAPPAT